jgi:WD40 repeat protein
MANDDVRSLAFTPDGRKLAAGSFTRLRIWDLGGSARSQGEGSRGQDTTWWTLLAVGGIGLAAGLFGLWLGSQFSSPRRHPWLQGVARRWRKLVGAVAILSGIMLLGVSLCLVASSRRDTGNGRDTGENASLSSDFTEPAAVLAISPDGRTLATAGEKNMRLWDISGRSPRKRAMLKLHGQKESADVGGWRPGTAPCPVLAVFAQKVFAVAFARTGGTMATADADGTVRLWKLGKGKPRARAVLRGHTSAVEALVFAPDGRTLVSGGWDSTLRLWDLTGKPLRETAASQGEAVLACSAVFAADGRTLVLGCADRTVQMWDLGEEAPRQRLVIRGLREVAWKLALSPDTKRLAIGYPSNTVQLWDLEGGLPRERLVLPGPKDEARVRAFSESWRTVVGIEYPPTMLAPHVMFAPDGKTLLASRMALRLWDLGGALPRELAVPPEPADARSRFRLASYTGQVFTPDGRTLALHGHRGEVLLWDLRAGKWMERPAIGGDGYLSFSPDGRTLASLASPGWATKTLPAFGATAVGLGAVPRGTGPFSLAAGLITNRTSKSKLAVSWWDVVSKQPRGEVVLEGDPGMSGLAALNFQTVALVHQGSLTVWSALTGKKLRRYALPGWERSSFHVQMKLAPDGRHLATVNPNGTVYILRFREHGASEQAPVRPEQALRQDVAASFRRGLAHARWKEYDRAIADFSRVIRLDPRHARAYYQRGLLYAEKKDFAQARADLDRAINIDPQVVEKP